MQIRSLGTFICRACNRPYIVFSDDQRLNRTIKCLGCSLEELREEQVIADVEAYTEADRTVKIEIEEEIRN